MLQSPRFHGEIQNPVFLSWWLNSPAFMVEIPAFVMPKIPSSCWRNPNGHDQTSAVAAQIQLAMGLTGLVNVQIQHHPTMMSSLTDIWRWCQVMSKIPNSWDIYQALHGRMSCTRRWSQLLQLDLPVGIQQPLHISLRREPPNSSAIKGGSFMIIHLTNHHLCRLIDEYS